MTDQREQTHDDLTDVPEQGEAVEEVRVYRRAWIGRFLGPVLAVVAYFTLPAGQDGLAQAGVATVSVGILMAVWWITEALPLPATALLPSTWEEESSQKMQRCRRLDPLWLDPS